MSTGLAHLPKAEPISRQVHRFSVDDFSRLSESGALGPDHARLELIDGEIFEPMSIGPSHAAVVDRLNRILNKKLEDSFTVRCQGPVRLSEVSEPQPDISVLRASPGSFSTVHPGPTDIALLIEVADSTLDFDTGRKVQIYASACIGEYWVVDVAAGELTVFRAPRGGRFTETVVKGRHETVESRSVPGLSILISDIVG